MKINPINLNPKAMALKGSKNNISFCKTLLNTTNARTQTGCSPALNFMKYDSKDANDREQIGALKSIWGRKDIFTEVVVNEFLYPKTMYYISGGECFSAKKYFCGLEDRGENVLAFAVLLDKQNIQKDDTKNLVHISFIQVNPDEKYSAEDRNYRGLGETLVMEIVKQAKESGKDYIELYSASEGFWQKSKLFKKVPSKDNNVVRCLYREDFDKYIEYVEGKKCACGAKLSALA